VLVSNFDFHLPPELIAQEPLADRSASRMLVLDRDTGTITDDQFRNFPTRLHHGDVLVLNNSRVFPARLFGHRSGKRAQPLSSRNPASREFLQGKVEVLLTRALGNGEWEALVRPGRKLGIGEVLRFGNEDEAREPLLEAEIVGRGEYGERRLRFASVPNFFELVERIGHVPLPPYIDRDDEAGDRERYQTVFARNRGSAAAPTAGLHFTPEILDEIRSGGVEIVEVTLHVGLGTFQPLREERVETNKLHVESFTITSESAKAINRALDEKRRVVAVGTTVVRTLEHAALESGRIRGGEGETSIFIYPGFRFRVVGGLLTNFHLPQSSLIMLVAAFAGQERVLEAYRHAVEEKYRFFSYGDCMFVTKTN